MSSARRWQVEVSRRAEKALRKLPSDVRRRVGAALDALASNPRPQGCKKLAGHEALYRIRVGDWRIVYAIEDDRLIVVVVTVVPRGRAYREL